MQEVPILEALNLNLRIASLKKAVRVKTRDLPLIQVRRNMTFFLLLLAFPTKWMGNKDDSKVILSSEFCTVYTVAVYFTSASEILQIWGQDHSQPITQ